MTKAELQEVRHLREVIPRLETKLETLKYSAEQITAQIDGLPKNHSNKSRVEKISVAIVDTENKIAELKQRQLIAAVELTAKLQAASLPDEIFSLFVLRYVNCLAWYGVAKKLNMSETHTYYLHRQGLRRLMRQ